MSRKDQNPKKKAISAENLHAIKTAAMSELLHKHSRPAAKNPSVSLIYFGKDALLWLKEPSVPERKIRKPKVLFQIPSVI